MNLILEELKSKAQRLTPNQELEMYAPYPKYMSLLEAAIKEQHHLSPVNGGFMLKLNEVPVIIKPTGLDQLAKMEGSSDHQHF